MSEAGINTPPDSRTQWLQLIGPCPFYISDQVPDNGSHELSSTGEALSINATASDVEHQSRLILAWAVVFAQYANSTAIALTARLVGTPIPSYSSLCVNLEPDQRIQRSLEAITNDLKEWEQSPSQNTDRGSKDESSQNNARTMSLIMPWQCHNKAGPGYHSDCFNGDVIRLVLEKCDEGLLCRVLYDNRLCCQVQASRVLHHFVHVACQLIRVCGGQHEMILDNIDPIPPGDWHTISQWNQHTFPPVSQCLQDLVARTARDSPTSLAVDAWDGQLNYYDLDEVSSQLAGRLIRTGLPKGSLVALLFEKSQWMIVSVLAVLKAGGVCLALCATTPNSYCKRLLEEANPRLLLSSSSQATRLKDIAYTPLAVPDILINEPSPPCVPPFVHMEHIKPTPQDPAFVIFTSGSTGKPKQALLTHEAIMTTTYYQADVIGIGSDSRVLQFSSHAWDVFVMESWWALARGAVLCIPSETQRIDALPTFINECKPNVAFFTPTVLRSYHPAEIRCLRKIVIGGENVPQDLIKQWTSYSGSFQLFDLWGPAETAGASVCEIDPSRWIPGTVGSGTACRLWITRPHAPGQLAAIGAIGEVLIEGDIVAEGYLNDPVRTQQAFIPAPEWRKLFPYPVQRRFYRTGDLVHYNPDGSVRYVGRKGSITKINGQRVDVDAVESTIRTQTTGRNVAVDAVSLKLLTGGSPSLLVAFLETPAGAEVTDAPGTAPSSPIRDARACAADAARLQRVLEQHLPSFMVPSFFIPLTVLPRTTTGKLDRKRMREIAASFSHDSLIAWLAGNDIEGNTRGEGDNRLLSAAEKLIVTAIADILGIETRTISLGMTFRQVGGDSVSAVRLSRAIAEHGHCLAINSLLNGHLTLRELAKSIQQPSDDTAYSLPGPFQLLPDSLTKEETQLLLESAAQQCQLAITAIEDIYPCTPLQEGLLTTTSTLSSEVYVDRILFQLPLATSIDRLQKAWHQVMRSVSILRTRIVQSNTGESYQVVVSQNPPWHQCSTVDEFTRDDPAIPMGFNTPLIHVSYIEKPARQLAITMHHAIYDRWTLSLMLRLLDAAYAGVILERPLSFSAFVQDLQQHREPEKMIEFWREEMSNLQPITYPEYPHPNYQPRATCRVHITAPRQASVDASPTVQMRLAWALLLSNYQGSDDVVYGTVVDGRRIGLPGVEGLFGPTLATVPCRTQIQRGKTIRESLVDIRACMSAMAPFEQSGLQRIARVSPEASLACHFRSLLVVQADGDEQLESAVLGRAKFEVGALGDFPGYGQILLCQCQARTWSFELLVDENIVSRSQAERMLQQLSHLVDQIADEERPLRQLNLVSLSDEKQLTEWQASTPQSVDRFVDDLVAAHAAASPASVAVEAWDGEFTFAQLEQEASQLAGYLRSCNVRRHDIVPIVMERSSWVPVAMLGVLKAGAAFVLLDHTQSLSHHQNICRTVRARIVVSCTKCTAQARHLLDSVVVIGGPTKVYSSARSLCVEGRMDEEERRERQISDPAYVVFTSGSTGKPKGVVIEHRQSASAILAQQKHLLITAQSRVLQLSSFAFDSFAVEILTTLCSGGCVCIPTDDECRHDISGAVNRFQATWMVITPSLLRLVDANNVPTLRTVVAVGESMLPAQAAQWASRVQLLCGYGPTECCTGASVQPVPSCGTSVSVDVRNIGAGMGARLWVVDPDDHEVLVPIGAVGELIIEGPIVGRGYIDDREKTRAAFLDSVNWMARVSSSSHRLYKTGDLVRYTEDGTCLFLGRKSQQIKLRGQRLDVTEVERHLHQGFGPGSRIVAAAIQPNGDQSHPLLVAMVHGTAMGNDHTTRNNQNGPDSLFLLPTPSSTQNAQRVHELLRTVLPPIMVPGLYLRVARMQLLPSGKINRATLQQAASELSITELLKLGRLAVPGEDEGFPQSETTAWTLTRLLADILKRKVQPEEQDKIESLIVGHNVAPAHFGFDSIDAVALSRLISQHFAVTIAATTILQSTLTVRALAGIIDAPDDLPDISNHRNNGNVADWWHDYQKLVKLVDQLPVIDHPPRRQDAWHQPGHGNRVFVTGATGYLGTQILHQLLCNPAVQSVTVLVRARNETEAMARVICSARQAQWWREEFRRSIIPWTGDLAVPRLGLADAQWETLCGRGPAPFDAIIHNGAMVHWVYDYGRLCGSNVQGTLSLLTALAHCSAPMPFTYVSALQPGSDTVPDGDAGYPDDPSLAVGYTQTKYVSEMLISRFAKQRADQHAVAIVRPGLMIGSPTDGIANTDDVIWRTVAAAIEIGAYNGDEDDAWLYVAPVDSVAAVIIHETLCCPRGLEEGPIALTSIEDGLYIKDFWYAIQYATMQSLDGLTGTLWWDRIKAQVKTGGQSHSLWPVMDFIETTAGRLGLPTKSTRLQPASLRTMIWMAVVRNAQYLCSLGAKLGSTERSAGLFDRSSGRSRLS